jgi:hypothetical protein
VFILNVTTLSKKYLHSFTPVPSRQNDGRPRRQDGEQPCLRDDVVRYYTLAQATGIRADTLGAYRLDDTLNRDSS